MFENAIIFNEQDPFWHYEAKWLKFFFSASFGQLRAAATAVWTPLPSVVISGQPGVVQALEVSLQGLEAMACARDFLSPVRDAHYKSVVRRPMDLSTIKARLPRAIRPVSLKSP